MSETPQAPLLIESPSSELRPDIMYDGGHLAAAKEWSVAQGLGQQTDAGFVYSGRLVSEDGAFPEGTVEIRNLPGGGEALVVDSLKDPEGFKPLSDAYDSRIANLKERTPYNVMRSIYDAVNTTMKYDLEYTNQRAANADNPARKTSLGGYIIDGKGVCLHMAVAQAWLGGKAVQDESVTGRLTSESNQTEIDAHAWSRYTPGEAEEGDILIMDPAQNFFGTLKEAVIYGKWEYFHPGEKENLFARPVGEMVTDQIIANPELSKLEVGYNKYCADAKEYLAAISATNVSESAKLALHAGGAKYLDTSGTLLAQALAGKDISFAHALNEELLQPMANDMPYRSGFEDIDPTMILDRSMVAERMRRLLTEAKKQYQPGPDWSLESEFIQKYAPRIDEQLRKALGK